MREVMECVRLVCSEERWSLVSGWQRVGGVFRSLLDTFSNESWRAFQKKHVGYSKNYLEVILKSRIEYAPTV